jgi:peptidoglycan/LPS O-acetylase OafA/YrhL
MSEVNTITMSTSSDKTASTTNVDAPPARPHFAFLDGLRGLMAFWVVMCHANCTVWHNAEATGLLWWATSPWIWGHMAVAIFIALSGFCLMMPLAKAGYQFKASGWKGTADFYARRFRRIVPTYWIALTISLVLALTVLRDNTGSHYDQFLPVLPRDIWSHYALVHNLYMNGLPLMKINGAYWSIAVECQIYLFFPLIVWMCRKADPVRVLVGLAGLAFVANELIRSQFPQFVWSYAHFYGIFALGALGAVAAFDPSPRFERWRSNAAKWKWGGAAILAGVSAWMASIGVGPALDILRPSFYAQDYAVAAGVIALLVSCTFPKEQDAPGAISRFLSWKPLVSVGTMAYSVYLLHELPQQLLWQAALSLHLSRPLTYLLITTVGTVLVLALARVFYLVAERPFATSKAPGKKTAEMPSATPGTPGMAASPLT